MVTISLVVIGAFVVLFLFFVVMRSGNKGGRHDQSSQEAVNKQRNQATQVTKRAVDGRD